MLTASCLKDGRKMIGSHWWPLEDQPPRLMEAGRQEEKGHTPLGIGSRELEKKPMENSGVG